MQEEPSLGLFLPWGRGLEATRPAGAAGSRKYLPRLPSAAGGKGRGGHTARSPSASR